MRLHRRVASASQGRPYEPGDGWEGDENACNMQTNMHALAGIDNMYIYIYIEPAVHIYIFIYIFIYVFIYIFNNE